MLCVLKRHLFPSSKRPLSPLDQGAFASSYFIPFAHTAFPARGKGFPGGQKGGRSVLQARPSGPVSVSFTSHSIVAGGRLVSRRAVVPALPPGATISGGSCPVAPADQGRLKGRGLTSLPRHSSGTQQMRLRPQGLGWRVHRKSLQGLVLSLITSSPTSRDWLTCGQYSPLLLPSGGKKNIGSSLSFRLASSGTRGSCALMG